MTRLTVRCRKSLHRGALLFGFACFLSSGSPDVLTNKMVFDIFFTGGTPDFSLPHLKVDFWANNSQTQSTGNLLSMDIPAGTAPPPTSVPEPATLALFGMGLVAVGFARRRALHGAQRSRSQIREHRSNLTP